MKIQNKIILEKSPKEAISKLLATGKYSFFARLPVFCCHTRVDENGTPVYNVCTADLFQIAHNTNETIGQTLPPVTLGHRDFSRDAKEEDQPTFVGFTANYEVEGDFIWCDFYHENNFEGQVPYRSVDYSPSQKRILGVALTKKPPYLDLGTVVYEINQPGSTTPNLEEMFPSLSRLANYDLRESFSKYTTIKDKL